MINLPLLRRRLFDLREDAMHWQNDLVKLCVDFNYVFYVNCCFGFKYLLIQLAVFVCGYFMPLFEIIIILNRGNICSEGFLIHKS